MSFVPAVPGAFEGETGDQALGRRTAFWAEDGFDSVIGAQFFETVPAARAEQLVKGQGKHPLVAVMKSRGASSGLALLPAAADPDTAIAVMDPSRVGLVRVEMEIHGKITGHPDQDMLQNKRPGSCPAHPDADVIPVLEPKLARFGALEMEVPLRYDASFRQFNLTAWPGEADSRRTGQIARVSHRRIDAEHERVRAGDLDLGLPASGAQYAHFWERALWPGNGNGFLTRELSGLREGLDGVQPMPGAKKRFEMFLGEMQVAG